ncbi:MAG: transglutaminase domain-containing protein [Lachnospiraceae bacterium]|nr:transglutaminase domain-containing protein [Lachnospiraceae bacterium]
MMTAFFKSEEKRIENELLTYGLSVGEPYTDGVGKRAYLCFIRGILVFLATFGTIGGLTAAFGLGFNALTIGLGLLVISILIAFTYFNKVTFYVGYILIFMVFLVLYVVAYTQINSGFQAFLNEVYKAYSDFFNLPSTRETTEYITDRSITVPATMFFTGAGFAILYNISISAYMDLFSTFLLSFLPMQLAFYIDIIPPIPYLVMLIAVYITVEVLSRSGRFKLPYKYKKGQQYSYINKKKKVRYEYLASGRGMVQMALSGILISSVLMVLLSMMFAGDFTTKYVSNKVKDKTDEYVQTLAQGGIASLFNRYKATGGISHGRMGGISSVSPDYETDLIVRTVPVSNEESGRVSRVYLKAYTGVFYEKDQFLSAIPGKTGESELSETDDYIPVGANYMDTDKQAYMKLWLMNVDADNVYDYRPYYTLYSSSGRGARSTGLSENIIRYAKTELKADNMASADADLMSEWVDAHKEENENCTYYELIYTPYSESAYYEPNPTLSDEYEQYVYDEYTAVPDEIKDALDSVVSDAELDKIKVSRDDFDLTGIDEEYGEYLVLQQQRLAVLKALKDYYENNYSYSMMPGTTPIGRDTIEYFLSEQKRGFCVHFAASSAMVLRRIGIPTRYIEGYVIDPYDMTEGEVLSGDARDWVLGNAAGPESITLVDVEIPDANAHAWIEVYIDGYGWIPYEMTPPSDDDIEYGGIADFFAMLFSRTSRGGDGNNNADISVNTDIGASVGRFRKSGLYKAISSVDFLLLPLVIVILLITLITVTFIVIRKLMYALRIKKLLGERRYDEVLLIRYRRMLALLRKKGVVKKAYPTVSEVADEIKDNPGSVETDALGETVLKAAYSGGNISEAEYIDACEVMEELIKTYSKSYRSEN